MGKFASALMLAALFSVPSAQASQALAMQSGCLGCHKTDVKLVGPAFKDIAAKYAGDAAEVDRLTSKVKSGSKPGEPLVWGGAMMPASPASEENIKGVIEWIMTLK
ncbi:MAG: c-type cytochrome [Candidatus Thiodiazotropha lotti]|nr:c-type cytochrome [Candidatus Thiodiazotropha lotti]